MLERTLLTWSVSEKIWLLIIVMTWIGGEGDAKQVNRTLIQKKLSYLTIVSTPLESFLSSTRSLRREREKVKEYDKVQEVITIMEE